MAAGLLDPLKFVLVINKLADNVSQFIYSPLSFILGCRREAIEKLLLNAHTKINMEQCSDLYVVNTLRLRFRFMDRESMLFELFNIDNNYR